MCWNSCTARYSRNRKSNKVGIMAGASTPEESIQEILEKVEKIIEI